jgi:hypothetical protein
MNSAIRMVMSILHKDKYERKIRGEVFWIMTDHITGEVTRGHLPNKVTLDASILLARLLKSTIIPYQSEPRFGIYALALGTGDIAWDPNHPPAATNTQRSLFNELARKAISATNFVDPQGNISGVPTNIVDFTATFAPGEATGPLTEMGLLGGDIDPILANTNPILPPNGIYDPTVNTVGFDSLVNFLTFPVINKPALSSLSFTWRLTL